ncbi:MAG: hypothetical protein OEY79_01160 [Anaplasmataceae bacterium]|nr:hypothetical protein [Anaplasmataceae bacterium]
MRYLRVQYSHCNRLPKGTTVPKDQDILLYALRDDIKKLKILEEKSRKCSGNLSCKMPSSYVNYATFQPQIITTFEQLADRCETH